MNEKYNQLVSRQAEIKDQLAAMEARELNADEKKNYNSLLGEWNKNNRELDLMKRAAEAAPKATKKTLVGELREALNTNKRSITVSSYHDDVIDTEMEGILEPLYANSALTALGVRWYKGLPMGDIQVPVMTAGTVAWAGETGAAADAGEAFSHITLQPKRLTAYVDISKKLLAQDNIGAEEAIRRDLVNAINNQLEATIFGAAAGTASVPAGMFYGESAARTLADGTTFAKLCGIEAGVEEANVYSNVKYLLSPGSKADLRAMAKNGNGSQTVFVGNEVDGVPAIVTSNVAAGKFIYGDFSNLAVGSWGDVEIVIDPYTQAATGCVRLVVTAMFDAKILREAAFAFGRTRTISE